MLLPPAHSAALITCRGRGALSAFFWASLVRIFLLHHVTWSINSICHTIGERPFQARDKSANFWPLAILSFGESWHNMHHADPTAARHGVLRGQLDESARVIWLFEKFGWATDVRWPKAGAAGQAARRRGLGDRGAGGERRIAPGLGLEHRAQRLHRVPHLGVGQVERRRSRGAAGPAPGSRRPRRGRSAPASPRRRAAAAARPASRGAPARAASRLGTPSASA